MNFSEEVDYDIILRRFSRPLSVTWNITDSCNFQCRHCLSDSGRKKTDELSTDQCFQLIDQLADWGILSVWIGGGEPLIRPDILEILAKLKEKEIGCILATNGSLISHNNVPQLINYTDSIEISLDGVTNKQNKFLRVIPNGLDIVMAAAKMIRATSSDAYFSINSTIHKGNLNQVGELIDLTRKIEANKWAHNELFAMGRGKKLANMIMGQEDLYHFREILRQKEKEYADQGFKINSYVRLQDFERQVQFEKKVWHCSAGVQEIMIDECGNVYPCQRLQFPDFCFGKFPDQSLSEIWGKSRVREWFCNLSVEESECHQCQKYHDRMCNGGCRAEKWIKHGNLFSKDPLCRPIFS